MRRLRYKIFTLTLGVLVMTTSFLGIWGIASLKKQLEYEFKLRSLVLTRTFMYLSSEGLQRGQLDTLRDFLDALLADPDVIEAHLLNPQGATVISMHRDDAPSSLPFVPDPAQFSRTLASFTPQFRDGRDGNRRYKFVYQRLWSELPGGIETIGVCVFKLDYYRLDRQVQSIELVAISGIGAISVLALFVSYFFSSRLTKPLEQLRAAATAVARGNFSVSVPVKSKDEIGALAQTFNLMEKSLEAITAENALFFASLKEEKSKLDTVFAQMQSAAVLAEETGKVLLANDAANKILQVDRGNPQSIIAQCGANFRVSPSLEEILKSSERVVNFEAVREQPKKLILAGTANRIQPDMPQRAPVERRWLLLFRDITDQKQENMIKRSFLAVISHKINTPLSVFRGYAQLLMGRDQGEVLPDRRILESMATQSDNLAKLLDKLVRFVLLQQMDSSAADLKTVDIVATVKEVIESLQRLTEARQAVITFNHPREMPVNGEAQLLKSALLEVVENGIKFATQANKEVAVSLEAKNGQAIVRVQDHGPGIAPEEQEKIFSEFYQSEPSFTGQVEGWGLGLAFAKKVVEFHGGKLWIESKLGDGTLVSISLPLV